MDELPKRSIQCYIVAVWYNTEVLGFINRSILVWKVFIATVNKRVISRYGNEEVAEKLVRVSNEA